MGGWTGLMAGVGALGWLVLRQDVLLLLGCYYQGAIT